MKNISQIIIHLKVDKPCASTLRNSHRGLGQHITAEIKISPTDNQPDGSNRMYCVQWHNREDRQKPRRQQHSYTSASCGTDAFLAKISSASLCSSPLLSNDNRDTQFLDRPQHLDIHNPELVVTSCPLLRLIQHKPKHYQEILPALSYELP